MFKLHKNQDQGIDVKISFDTFFKIGVFILSLYILQIFIHRAAHALFLIGISMFLALALNAPVSKIASLVPGKKKGSRVLGTAISYLLVVVVLGTFLTYLTPPLVRQTNHFISQAPRLISDFKNQSGAVGNFIRKYNLSDQVNSISSQIGSKVHNLSGDAFNTVFSVGSSFINGLTVLVMTFMLLVEGPRWIEFLIGIVPDRRKKMARELSDDMYRVIKGYVNGQALLALIATAFITPALFILHISYPLAMILIIFICALIPMIGHSIGAVFIGTVAISTSISSAAIILAYYFLYLQFENYIIQPKIQANSTNMSPFLVFSSLILGLSLFGLLGGLVAIPIAGCIRIIILEYLRYKNLLQKKEFEETINPIDSTNN